MFLNRTNIYYDIDVSEIIEAAQSCTFSQIQNGLEKRMWPTLSLTHYDAAQRNFVEIPQKFKG